MAQAAEQLLRIKLTFQFFLILALLLLEAVELDTQVAVVLPLTAEQVFQQVAVTESRQLLEHKLHLLVVVD